MWVLEQIRISVDQNHFAFPVEYRDRLADMFGEKAAHGKRKTTSLCPNIITPNTIPEFFIPPKITPLQELKPFEWGKSLAAVAKGTLSENSILESNTAARESFSTHIIQVENVDEFPCSSGLSDEDSTNADPQSQAALSLPHLAKAQTCYGFCTLLESPHTRRKESIFHNDPGACGLPLPAPRGRATTSTYSMRPHCSSFSLNKFTSRRVTSPRVTALHRQGTLDSDTTSSTESSPFNSPLLARPSPKSSLLKSLGHDRLLSRTIRKAIVSRNDSLSTDEGSSTDNSPNIVRRASEGLLEPTLTNTFSLAPPALFPTDLLLYKDRVRKESLVPIGRDGMLRLSVEYCPDNQRLRVRLISAEGLYGMSVDQKSINCNVSVCLLPGKIQKQRSTVIKRSRNPIFNEDFFFDGICQEDIGSRALRFKVVNKMSTMKRDYILGDCEILLNSVLTA